MSYKSTKIALGGLFSALCLAIMFLSGIIPFATYALPAFAGAMLIAIVVENGRRTAVMVYISVSLLSLFIVSDKEAAMMFIAFFGYYPILKERLERVKSRIIEYVFKLLLFNITIVAGYSVLTFVIGIPFFEDEFAEFFKYGPLLLLAAGNILFLLYDYVLTRYFTVYVRYFRPRFLRK